MQYSLLVTLLLAQFSPAFAADPLPALPNPNRPAATDGGSETTESSGRGFLRELMLFGAGTTTIAVDRYLLAPDSRDYTGFERTLEAADADRIKAFVTRKIDESIAREAEAKGNIGRQALARIRSYLEGPVVVVEADSVLMEARLLDHNRRVLGQTTAPAAVAAENAPPSALTSALRRVPFLNLVGGGAKVDAAPAFKTYKLDATIRGGAPVVLSCLNQMQECEALVRKTGTTTNAHILARRGLRVGSSFFLALPVALNAGDLFLLLPIHDEKDVACLATDKRCGIDWFEKLRGILN